MDLMGLMQVESLGSKRFILFVLMTSQGSFGLDLSKKSLKPSKYVKLYVFRFNVNERKHYMHSHTDQRKEFDNDLFEKLCISKEILHEFCSYYSLAKWSGWKKK